MTFDRPANLNGEALTAELAAAGFADARVSDQADGTIRVAGVADADRAAVQAVLDAHVPPDPGPSKADKLADLRAKAEALPTNNPVRPILLGLIDAV